MFSLGDGFYGAPLCAGHGIHLCTLTDGVSSLPSLLILNASVLSVRITMAFISTH